MSLLTLFTIALGLSMDAFAVSITCGAAVRTVTGLRHPIRVAFFFGMFQAIMPLLGWFAGLSMASFIKPASNVIAFCLLCFIGIKMIYESQTMKDETVHSAYLSNYLLFTLAIATSIDALAVGITLSVLEIKIIFPVIVIGVVTFVMTFMGVCIGRKASHIYSDKIEIAGGLILIAIGVKVLLQYITT